jgi:hypothetical protein
VGGVLGAGEALSNGEVLSAGELLGAGDVCRVGKLWTGDGVGVEGSVGFRTDM